MKPAHQLLFAGSSRFWNCAVADMKPRAAKPVLACMTLIRCKVCDVRTRRSTTACATQPRLPLGHPTVMIIMIIISNNICMLPVISISRTPSPACMVMPRTKSILVLASYIRLLWCVAFKSLIIPVICDVKYWICCLQESFNTKLYCGVPNLCIMH
jgi:hypothetical protein